MRQLSPVAAEAALGYSGVSGCRRRFSAYGRGTLVELSRRELFKRLSSKNSIEVLRLFTPTGLKRFLGIGEDSRPSAEKAGLALRKRRKASASLKLLRSKTSSSDSRDSRVISEHPIKADPKGNGHDGE